MFCVTWSAVEEEMLEFPYLILWFKARWCVGGISNYELLIVETWAGRISSLSVYLARYVILMDRSTQ